MRYFDRLHPACAFVYFALMLILAMLGTDPAAALISFVSSVAFCGAVIGARRIFLSLAYTFPIMIIIALINPIFVHKGETVIFFLNSNPITLEAILYGAVSSLTIMSVIYWCRACGEIITEEKFIYLFGRISPRLALALSMTLGFIPRFRRKFQEIDEAQRALGIYATDSIADKVRARMRTLSALLGNVLEHSVETADSMSARGYELKGRTSYSNYRFSLSDVIYLAFTLIFGGASVVILMLGVERFEYYPALSSLGGSALTYVFYILLAILAGASLFMEVKENISWRYLRSKI